MNRPALVVVNDAERRARSWLPVAAKPGIWISPEGEAVRLGVGGTVAETTYTFPFNRGAASAPSNRRIP